MVLDPRKTAKPAEIDLVSRDLLPVVRHFLRNLSGAEYGSWRIAYSLAAEIWGEPRGLAIAHKTQALLTAVLSNRAHPLDVADPGCLTARGRLTPDETLLLALVGHMRAEEVPQARRCIAALTDGRIPATVVQAGLELCTQLGMTPPPSRRDPSRPRLRVVG